MWPPEILKPVFPKRAHAVHAVQVFSADEPQTHQAAMFEFSPHGALKFTRGVNTGCTPRVQRRASEERVKRRKNDCFSLSLWQTL